MKDPRIVIDISKWQDHVKPDELDGVEAVIIKSGSGMRRDPKFEEHGAMLANAGITLMAYHWDDITMDPSEQAEWALEDIDKTGLPIKFLWADQEQSWIDWEEFHDAALHKIAWSEVKRASSKNISLHNHVYEDPGFQDVEGICAECTPTAALLPPGPRKPRTGSAIIISGLPITGIIPIRKQK